MKFDKKTEQENAAAVSAAGVLDINQDVLEDSFGNFDKIDPRPASKKMQNADLRAELISPDKPMRGEQAPVESSAMDQN